MKRSLMLLPLLALAGCSSLNVSWQLTASYNTLVQSQSLTQHAPKVEEARPSATVPPALPPGKAS